MANVKEEFRMLGWRISDAMRRYPGIMEGPDKKNSIKTFGIGIAFFGMVSLAAGLTSGACRRQEIDEEKKFGRYCFVPFTRDRPNLGEAILTSSLTIITGLIAICIGKSNISVRRIQIFLLCSAMALNFSVIYVIRILVVRVSKGSLKREILVNLILVSLHIPLLAGSIVYVFKNSIDETLARLPVPYIPNKSDPSQDFRVAIQSIVSPRGISRETPPPRFSAIFRSFSKSSSSSNSKEKRKKQKNDNRIDEVIEDDVFN